MKNHLVSIIIPVYNVCKYVNESINSVIQQTYPYLEIIIIDDGSTDGFGEICDEIAKADNRIKVIHTENRGLSAARNLGLSVISGDIITFLDSDDAFVPNSIERSIQVMDKANADIVSFSFRPIKTEGSLNEENNRIESNPQNTPSQKLLNSEEALRLLLLERSFSMTVWGMVYRAHLWRDVAFPEGYVYEDNYVTPEILRRANLICKIPDTLVLIRGRNGSITHINSEKNMRDQFRAHQNLINFVRDNAPESYRNQLISQMHEDEIEIMIKQYCISGDRVYNMELRKQIFSKKRALHSQMKVKTKIKLFGLRFFPHLFSWLSYNLVFHERT